MEESGIKDYSTVERFWLLHAENELRRYFPQISKNLGIGSIPLSIDLEFKPKRPGYIAKNIVLSNGNSSGYAGVIFDGVLERFKLDSSKSLLVKIPTKYIREMGSATELDKYNKFLLDSLLNIEVSVLMETVEMFKKKVDNGDILGLGMGPIHEYLKGYNNWLRRIGWNDLKDDDKHSADLIKLWEDSYNKAIGKYSVDIVYKNHPVVGGTYKAKLGSKKLLEQLCDEKGGSIVESITALKAVMNGSGKEKKPLIQFPSLKNDDVTNDLALVAFPLLPASSMTLEERLGGGK